MRVIINAISATTGGIATYTNNLARSFKERNVDAIFAIPADLNLNVDVEKIIVKANKMAPFHRVLWEQLFWRRIVKKLKADILFSSANFGLLFCSTPQVLLLREGGLFDPFYLSNIGSLLKTRTVIEMVARRKLILESARSADLIITPSKTMKNQLTYWKKDMASRVEVNHYGTLPMLFKPNLRKRQWREDGVLKLLYVSAYYPHKQPGLITEAVHLLNSMGLPCHLTLSMSLDEIEQTNGGQKDLFLLSKSIKRGHLTMMGNISYFDLPSIYTSHDLFVFPSISETFGHPLVEAMGMGLPIVAADTAIHREICESAAMYFSPLKPSSLIKQIQLLDGNETLRKSITTSGSEYISKRYQWEHHVDRLIESFEKIAIS